METTGRQWAVLVWLTWLPTLSAEPKINAPTAKEQRPAVDLVAQLGHPKYQQREHAATALLVLGHSALPAIYDGLRSTDEEIVSRCTMLLPRVRQAGWMQRGKRYQEDVTAKLIHELPFQSAFERLYGGSPNAGQRELFATIIKQNGEWLDELTRNPQQQSALFAERVRCLLANQTATFDEPNALDRSDLGAVLLVNTLLPETHLTVQAALLLENPTLLAMLRSDRIGTASRQLLVHWIRSRPAGDDFAVSNFIRVVERFSFSEAEAILATVARDPNRCVLTVRVPAVNALTKMANPNVEKTLTDLLSDRTLAAGSIGLGTERFLGDCALAALLMRQGHSLNDYGMTMERYTIVLGSTGLEWPITVHGFDRHELRKQAHARWQKVSRDKR